MNRLTIIPSDRSVYIDDGVYFNLELPFIPSDVHALQWLDNAGWIEFNNGNPNEDIDTLPEWAMQAVEVAENSGEPPTPITLESYEMATHAKIEEVAASLGYSSSVVLVGYVSSTVSKWKQEALAFIEWRDNVWVYAQQQLDLYQGSPESAPSVQDYVNSLPVFTLDIEA